MYGTPVVFPHNTTCRMIGRGSALTFGQSHSDD
jgi:hypothetical protein